MRVIVSVSDDPSEWFEKLEPQNLRFLMKQIRQAVILVPVSSDKRRLRSAISGLEAAARELISELIECLPMAAEGTQAKPDSQIGFSESCVATFDSELEAILDLCQRRSELATTDETSSSVFSRTIGVLAATANRLEIFDKYFVSSIINQRHWAITELLKNQSLQLSVVSEVSRSTRERWSLDTTPQGDWERRISDVQRSWSKLLNQYRSGEVSKALSKIELISAKRGALRNRFMIFYFAENQPVSLAMLHGLEDFSGVNIREETQFSLESNAAKVASIKSSWQSREKSDSVAILTWSGASLKSISSAEFPSIRTS